MRFNKGDFVPLAAPLGLVGEAIRLVAAPIFSIIEPNITSPKVLGLVVYQQKF